MIFRKTNRKVVGGLILGSASLCVVVALVSFAYTWNFVSHATRTSGNIKALNQHSDNYYYPVFAFDDATGAHHTIYSNTGCSSPNYQIGDKISVLYTPSNPSDANIDDFFAVWILPLATGAIAVLYLPLGLIVWFWPAIAGSFRKKSSAISN
jgi:hypothetical protein